MDKRELGRLKEKYRKSPPRVTREHEEKAERMFKKVESFEKQKDLSLNKELNHAITDESRSLHKFFHLEARSVVGGFGDGKKVLCTICSIHEQEMFNMNDGKWYCYKHKSIGNMTQEQKREELAAC